MEKIFKILAIIIILIPAAIYIFILYQTRLLKTTPPGCIKNRGVVFGGCLGKNKNKNFKIVPKLPSCLTIKSHECNGAKLEIENLCGKDTTIILEGERIINSHQYLLFIKNKNGIIIKAPKNYNDYPDKEENIVLHGSVNGRQFTVSYLRTPALCQ